MRNELWLKAKTQTEEGQQFNTHASWPAKWHTPAAAAVAASIAAAVAAAAARLMRIKLVNFKLIANTSGEQGK